MKKAFLLSCCLCLSLQAKYQPVPLDNVAKSPICLTMPSSGTNWLLASLQFLTHRPVKRSITAIPGKVIDENKAAIYHAHFPSELISANRNNKLIIITRNYRELLLRYAKYNPSKTLNLEKLDVEYWIRWYRDMLECFDFWPSHNRLLITYEDLLLKPQQVYENLLDFLDEKRDLLDTFLENLGTYKEQTLRLYNRKYRRAGGSVSRGTDVLFHTMQVDGELIEQIDQMMQKDIPQRLWEAYLQHYCTPVDKENMTRKKL